jgi:hypothetical protein
MWVTRKKRRRRVLSRGLRRVLRRVEESSFQYHFDVHQNLRWEPWHQGDRTPQPCHPGARAFFLFFIFFYGGN